MTSSQNITFTKLSVLKNAHTNMETVYDEMSIKTFLECIRAQIYIQWPHVHLYNIMQSNTTALPKNSTFIIKF